MASSGRRPKAGISCPSSTRLANRQDDGAQRRRYAGNHSSCTNSRNRGPPERPSAVCGAFPRRSARASLPGVLDGHERGRADGRPDMLSLNAPVPDEAAMPGRAHPARRGRTPRCPRPRIPSCPASTCRCPRRSAGPSAPSCLPPRQDRRQGLELLRGPWRRTGGRISGWSPPSRDRAGGRRRARSRRRAAPCWRTNAWCRAGGHPAGRLPPSRRTRSNPATSHGVRRPPTGKTHPEDRGRLSRTPRAASHSQTVRGPVLLSGR